MKVTTQRGLDTPRIEPSMLNRLLRTLLLVAPLAGCGVAPVGVSGAISIPHDARNVCSQQCGTIGMNLSAVAIMANNIGCVCQTGAGAPPVATTGASSAAGMATISMLEEQEQEQQQQLQQQQQQQQEQLQQQHTTATAAVTGPPGCLLYVPRWPIGPWARLEDKRSRSPSAAPTCPLNGSYNCDRLS